MTEPADLLEVCSYFLIPAGITHTHYKKPVNTYRTFGRSCTSCFSAICLTDMWADQHPLYLLTNTCSHGPSNILTISFWGWEFFLLICNLIQSSIINVIPTTQFKMAWWWFYLTFWFLLSRGLGLTDILSTVTWKQNCTVCLNRIAFMLIFISLYCIFQLLWQQMLYYSEIFVQHTTILWHTLYSMLALASSTSTTQSTIHMTVENLPEFQRAETTSSMQSFVD